MPTINLTNNTTLNITASSADENSTLNRYLKNPLSFTTPAGLDAILGENVVALDPTAFPITAAATGAGQFAAAGISLNVQLSASASVGLLTGANASDFFSSVLWTSDPAAPNLLSFSLQGTISAGDSATVSDLSFGITKAATVTLTSFCTAAGTDKFEDAVGRAIAALTIPHDVTDLRSLPANTACQMDASSSLTFTASVTYNILNDLLATTSISNLPSIAINATASATVEGTATHTSDHTVTIAKLSNGLIHLSVNLSRTDDFETSLTVSRRQNETTEKGTIEMTKKTSNIRIKAGSGDVFRDLGFPNPEREQIKARLTLQIYRLIKDRGLTQAAAGEILGSKQPHVSGLMRGRSGNFSVDRLIDFLTALGQDVEITVKPTRREHGEVHLVLA